MEGRRALVIGLVVLGAIWFTFAFPTQEISQMKECVSQIAFVSYPDGSYLNREIYLINLDGNNFRNLTSNGADDYDLTWSPDGNLIAFVSNRDGNEEIYLLDIERSISVNLTRNAAADYSPVWSPTGNQLAFVTDREGRSEIYLFDFDLQSLHNLTTYPYEDVFPVWSPDGKQIIFISYYRGSDSVRDVYTVNIQTGETIQLANLDPKQLEISGPIVNPIWSPDGKLIAFFVRYDGRHKLFMMNADGTNLQSFNPEIFGSVVWSPDSQQLLFEEYVEIKVLDLESGEIHELTDNRITNSFSPDWSPNGDHIVYGSCYDIGKCGFYLMDSHGNNVQKITDWVIGGTGNPPQISWRPNCP
jgi:TolB protein